MKKSQELEIIVSILLIEGEEFLKSLAKFISLAWDSKKKENCSSLI